MDIQRKIFITGVSGYIGASIAARLLQNPNNKITAVVRSKASVPKEIADKITLIEGSVYDPVFLRPLLKGHSVIIHNTIQHGNRGGDLELIRVLGEEARFASREQPGHFIYTSGLYTSGSGLECESEVAFEDTPPARQSQWNRLDLEALALSFTTLNLSVSIVRPAWVYGGRFIEKSYFQEYVSYCQKKGGLFYSGDLDTRIAFVHVDDLVELYALILQGPAKGIFHAFDRVFKLGELLKLFKEATGLEIKEDKEEELKKVLFYWAMQRAFSTNPGKLYSVKLGWISSRHIENGVKELFGENIKK